MIAALFLIGLAFGQEETIQTWELDWRIETSRWCQNASSNDRRLVAAKIKAESLRQIFQGLVLQRQIIYNNRQELLFLATNSSHIRRDITTLALVCEQAEGSLTKEIDRLAPIIVGLNEEAADGSSRYEERSKLPRMSRKACQRNIETVYIDLAQGFLVLRTSVGRVNVETDKLLERQLETTKMSVEYPGGF